MEETTQDKQMEIANKLLEKHLKFWKKRISNAGRVAWFFGGLSILASIIYLWGFIDFMVKGLLVGVPWVHGAASVIVFFFLGLIMIVLGKRLHDDIEDSRLHTYLVALSVLMSVLFIEVVVKLVAGINPGLDLILLLAPWYFFAALMAEKKLLAAGAIHPKKIEHKIGRSGWWVIGIITVITWVLSYLNI